MNESSIEITRQLPAGTLETVIDVFVEAFGLKLQQLELMTNDNARIRAALRGSLHPEHGIYALQNGRVVGLLGIEYDDGRRLVQMNLQALRRAFGRWGGFWRNAGHALQRFFVRRHRGALRIEYLAVASEARGRGIGTQLMAAAVDLARETGCRAVVLEVVDTNPRARQLYERLGFYHVRRQRTGILTRVAGFTAVDYYERDVSAITA